MDSIVEINSLLCTGCECCIEVCKKKILYIDDFKGLCKVSHQDLCDKDCACVKVCEPGAIKIRR